MMSNSLRGKNYPLILGIYLSNEGGGYCNLALAKKERRGKDCYQIEDKIYLGYGRSNASS